MEFILLPASCFDKSERGKVLGVRNEVQGTSVGTRSEFFQELASMQQEVATPC